VGIEAGFLGAVDVFLHAETGEGDGGCLPGFSSLPDQVDAGAIGQTELAEVEIRVKGFASRGLARCAWGGVAVSWRRWQRRTRRSAA
jgi:hypothetical protein